jgi:predicted SnoaL-like aldol condensation-catalyzing enzyme
MLRTRTFAVVAAALAASSLSGCSHAQAGRTAQEETNLARATAFYEAMFATKDFAAAETYLAQPYVEHDPEVADGQRGLEAQVAELQASSPSLTRTIEGAYVDDDYVILHAREAGGAEASEQARIDLYRIGADGGVAEHWALAQPIPPAAEAQNTNGMYYDVSPAEPAALSAAEEEENLRIAYEFYDAALNQKNWELARTYIGDRYVQHNLRAPSGPEGLEAHVAMVRETFPDNQGALQRGFVDGDRVFLHFHTRRSPDQLGMAVMDMFRLENGKVVEHWDVIQPIPEAPANDNGMFYQTE